jgi:N-acetylmuramoyl-L-alanine amidase
VLGLHRSQENLEVAKKENSVILLEDNYAERYEGFDPNSEESLIMFEMVQDEYIDRSISFASKVQTQLIKQASLFNREVKQAGFLVLRKTSMPSVLIELGFVSNAKECDFLMSKSGREKLAESIATAFGTYKNEIERHSKQTNVNSTIENEKEPKKVEASNEEINPKRDETPKNSGIIDIRTTKGVLYCVQVATSDKLLNANAKSLKAQSDLHFTIEKGLYKYYAAVSTSLSEVKKEYPQLSKKFKGAFIVAFVDGIKTDIKNVGKFSK